jgi:hypothetical protein
MDFGLRSLLNRLHSVVASFYSHRVWLAVVSLVILYPSMYYTHVLNAASDSDNLWPVITYSIAFPV